MFKVYIEADGPLEGLAMSLLEELKAVLADNSNLTVEAAEIKEAVDGFKANAAALNARIEELQATIANGGGVTEAQLAELLDLAKAKNAAISTLFTPDVPPTLPSGTGE